MSVYFSRYQHSFDQIFHKYRIGLISFASRLLIDQLAAEDIVTDVFIKYWQKENGFVNEFAASSFLYISTRNACLNYLTALKRKRRDERIMMYMTEAHEDPINAMARAESVIEAWNIIEGLPVGCRRVILLNYVKGLGDKKIAQYLGLSASTVKNQRIRGLQLIKQRYGKLNVQRYPNAGPTKASVN
jgi:RNA polymerase sigma-70 factor (ECF subfamily)